MTRFEELKKRIRALNLRKENLKRQKKALGVKKGVCLAICLISGGGTFTLIMIADQVWRVVTLAVLALVFTITAVILFYVETNYSKFEVQEVMTIENECFNIETEIKLSADECSNKELAELWRKLDEIREDEEWRIEEYDEI